jgi:tetratricopeptide (TPR) repeat protein
MEESLAAGLNVLGLIAHYAGRYAEAEALYGECLTIAQKIDARQQIAHSTINMAALRLLQGNAEGAAPLLAESFGIFIDNGDKGGICEGLEGVAWLAHHAEKPERAVCLFSAAMALREKNTLFLPDFVQAIYDGILSSIKEDIVPAAFDRSWEEGQSMGIQEAVGFALQDSRVRPLRHLGIG